MLNLVGVFVVGSTVSLDKKSFEGAVKQKLAVIDFWAEWCGPCRTMNPILEELAAELKGKVFFGKVNIDENPGLAQDQHISAVPTLLIFSNGKLVDQVIGATPKQALKQKILEHG